MKAYVKYQMMQKRRVYKNEDDDKCKEFFMITYSKLQMPTDR